MRIQTDEDRRAAEQTLKEVTSKLEEALRLAREQERAHEEHRCSAGAHV